MKNVAEKYAFEIEKSKSDIKTYFDLMREGNAQLRKTSEEIGQSMVSITVKSCKEVKDEITKDIKILEQQISIGHDHIKLVANVVDFNAKVVNDRVTKIENWVEALIANKGSLINFTKVEGELKSTTESFKNYEAAATSHVSS